MLEVILLNLIPLPFMCGVMCTYLEFRYHKIINILSMILLTAFMTFADAYLYALSGSYNFMMHYYLYTTTLPSFFCFFILSKNRGLYFMFAYLSTCMLNTASNVCSHILCFYICPNNIVVQLTIRVLILCAMIYISWKYISSVLYTIQIEKVVNQVIFCLFPAMILITQSLITLVDTQKPETDGTIYLPYFGYTNPSILPGYFCLEVTILFSYYFVMLALNSYMDLNQQKKELYYLNVQAATLRKQYEEAVTHEDALRILRHDMRHNINIIETLLENGKLSDAREQLSSYSNTLASTKLVSFCDNVTINAVFSYFDHTAKEAGIETSFKLDIPEKLPVANADLAVVLSNALENALHACGKLSQNTKPYIHVVYRRVNEQSILEISNPYEGNISFNRRGYPTSERSGHGIGSQSIVAFAKKYQAHVSYQMQDQVFRLRILMVGE